MTKVPTFIQKINPGVVDSKDDGRIALGFPTDRSPFVFEIDRGKYHAKTVEEALLRWLESHIAAALGEQSDYDPDIPLLDSDGKPCR